MIELRTLAYFVTACRAEDFTHAAKELGIAGSTLSTTMKGLSEELGVTLFRRVRNTRYPTGDARALVRAAAPLLMAEAFARRWIGGPDKVKLRVLTVDIALSFTIGAMSVALRRAVDEMGRLRPDVFVDPVWSEESHTRFVEGLTKGWTNYERSRVVVALDDGSHQDSKFSTTLLTDKWVLARRIPASTRHKPSAADLTSGRLIVPMLSPLLLEQADRYFNEQKITGVRFLNDHPDDLPQLIEEYPDATLFVPSNLITPRLGMLNIAAVAPKQPLTIRIVARTSKPDAAASLFSAHLRRALATPGGAPPERPLISLRQIRYFGMVHRLRRVSAAAHGANISQPALSEQLLKLEASLGGALFERQSDGVIPTSRGDRFAVFANVLEAGFHRLSAGDEIATARSSPRLAFGILPSVNQHGLLVNHIMEAMLEIRSHYPSLRLVVREAPNSTLQDWVLRGLVGVAIVETALPHMPRLPLGSSEELAAVAHPRHELLAPGPVRLSDLIRQKLVLPTNGSGLRQLLESAAEKRGFKIEPYIEIDALPMVVSILARLPVCAVLPRSAVQREIDNGDIVAHHIVNPVISRNLFVIYSGDRALNKPERALVNSLRKRLSVTSTAE